MHSLCHNQMINVILFADFRVESQHGSKKRRYFVSELANVNSLTHEFDLEGQARRVTVEQYFRERYNIQLE